MKPHVLSALILVHLAPSLAAEPARRTGVWEWWDVPRVVAIGDLHGSYDKLVQLLEGARLVDASLAWTGGETHLVVAGDFLDRGSRERPLMDLLRKLQEGGAAAGGAVHVLLGNHEVMGLLRDTRYVHADSYRDFAAEERKRDRQAAWRSFPVGGEGRREPGDLESLFKNQFPRGYFGRQRVLDRGGEYGAWLLRQPAIVKLNGVVYVHGGLTEDFAVLGAEGINRGVRDQLRRHLKARETLQGEGIITSVMDYTQLQEAAAAVLRRNPGAASSRRLRDAARALLESARSSILGGRGPLWYRGNSNEDERIERDIIERCLELVGAEAMVVAHSYTGGDRITSRFHGQLFRLDHGILESRRPLALVIEHGEVLVLDPSTKQTSEPIAESPNGSAKPPLTTEISDPALVRFLREATRIDSRDLGRGGTRPRLLVLEKEGQKRRGIFKTVEQAGGPGTGEAVDRYQHEAAAYLLDRRVGLNIVPATVIRDVDGRRGSLQWWVEGAVDLQAVNDYGLELCESGIAAHQLALGEVFDLLIGNEHRKPSDVLCLVNDVHAFMIDHSRAFSESPELSLDEGRAYSITSRLAEALWSLDQESLTTELGDLLSDRQIVALLARRDKLLDRVSVSDSGE